MDQHTRANWVKIKVTLEAAGKTDCMFYKRALAVLQTGRDPFEIDGFSKLERS